MSHKGRIKLRAPNFLLGLGGQAGTAAIRAWMRTLDLRAVFYDGSVDPALGFDRSRVYVFWHENILMPLYLRGHCDLTMLLSQHGDADILAKVAHNFGFECVRGSTYRGAARALLELTRGSVKTSAEGGRAHFAPRTMQNEPVPVGFETRTNCSRRRHLTLTPDGPRGPRRRMAQGPIYLASRLQLPLVVMGFGYDRPWRVRSWDRFAVPRPFSRGRAVIGPPMMLPTELDRAGLEDCRQRAERLLNCLTCEAEAWAEAGTSKSGEVILRPERLRGTSARTIALASGEAASAMRAA